MRSCLPPLHLSSVHFLIRIPFFASSMDTYTRYVHAHLHTHIHNLYSLEWHMTTKPSTCQWKIPNTATVFLTHIFYYCVLSQQPPMAITQLLLVFQLLVVIGIVLCQSCPGEIEPATHQFFADLQNGSKIYDFGVLTTFCERSSGSRMK